MNSNSKLSLLKNRYKRRWLLLGIIWLFGISLFLWNINAIEHLSYKKAKMAYIKANINYITRHIDKLKWVTQQRDKMYDHIPNIKIGILGLQEKLNKLASKNKISITHIEYEEISEINNNLTITLICSGPLQGFIKMLLSIAKTYLYIRTKTTDIIFTEPNKNVGEYKIKFVYNYKLIDKK